MEEAILHHPWGEILENSVAMVTGASKSGTTVAAMLLASMKPTYHIYEPAMLKIMPPGELDKTMLEIFRTTFLFDYCVPIARGARICDYEFQTVHSEWQWGTRQSTRSRRRGNPKFDGSSIFVYLLRERPLFVVNMLDGLPRIGLWEQLFPGMRTLHIVRNGFDVIASSVKRRNWYSDDYFKVPMHFGIDWILTKDGSLMPWYVDEDAKVHWPGWDLFTRAAHIWRVQVDMYPPQIRFEELTTTPGKVLNMLTLAFKFLEPTDLTEKWLRRLTMKQIPPHELTLNDIQEPERSKFKKTMEYLGYL